MTSVTNAVINGGVMIDRTNAERQRRYIARLKAQAGLAKGVSDAAVSSNHAALVKDLARAEARIAELEARIRAMGLERAAERRAFRDERKRRAAKPARKGR